MSRVDQLERDLAAWFAEAPTPTPDFLEDILLETAGTRQRPPWTFLPVLPRPMGPPLLRGVGDLRTQTPARRLVIVLAIIGLLAIAAGAVWVGGRRPLPAPFGAAANGLVAYEKGGDIFVVDPETGERRGLVIGPEWDEHPRWSLDGTRLAFLRGSGTGQRLVIIDEAGNVQAVSGGDELVSPDLDSIAWAPDGRSVLVMATFAGRQVLYLVDSATGAPRILPVTPWGLEAYWRPPDGRELLFVGGTAPRPALFRYSLADGAVTEVPNTRFVIPAGVDDELRPIGWTADGSRFAYHRRAATDGPFETHVVEVETGDEVVLDVAYGRISNDGARIVGVGSDGDREWLCVAAVAGGPCEPIEGSVGLVEPTSWASFQWAPDDSWIRGASPPEGAAVLLSPTGAEVQRPPWALEGADSWQRRAP